MKAIIITFSILFQKHKLTLILNSGFNTLWF